MAAQTHEAASSGSQNTSFERGLTFKLTDGNTGEITPEERRIYDHIIHCNVGVFPAAGLTGQYTVLRSHNRWSH